MDPFARLKRGLYGFGADPAVDMQGKTRIVCFDLVTAGGLTFGIT